MKLPENPAVRVLLALLALLVAAVVVGFFWRGDYPTTQTARRSFTIDEDFTTVRKILVRTNGAKQIVTMGGDSEFVDQKWSDAGVELGELKLLDPKWKLELHGTLRVRTKDEYVGQQVVSLAQDVVIEPDFLDSKTKLTEPSERLKDYAMTTRFERVPTTPETDKPTSKIDLSLTQEILTSAPWWAHRIADRRVRASAERTLANQEAAIRKLIAENKDKAGIFPLR